METDFFLKIILVMSKATKILGVVPDSFAELLSMINFFTSKTTSYKYILSSSHDFTITDQSLYFVCCVMSQIVEYGVGHELIVIFLYSNKNTE
jgi:hypothetical protein